MLPLFLIGLIGHLFAATFEINKDHSRISYKIPYMTFSESEGSFTDYLGIIEFDQEKKELKAIKAQIQVASIDTQDKKRDAHLKKSDFFYIDKFPVISFDSKKIKRIDSQQFDVEGLLEIRGKRKTIHIIIEFKGEKRDHVGKNSLFFKAVTKINRRDFGITWNKSLDKTEYLLGDEVTINLVIQAQPQSKKTAFASHMIPATLGLEKYARIKRGEIPAPSLMLQPLEKNSKNQEASLKKIPLPAISETSATTIPWIELIVGFLGFILLIFISFYVKMGLIKLFKQEQYSESGSISLVGDGLIIGLTFLYSVWYFNYLYP